MIPVCLRLTWSSRGTPDQKKPCKLQPGRRHLSGYSAGHSRTGPLLLVLGQIHMGAPPRFRQSLEKGGATPTNHLKLSVHHSQYKCRYITETQHYVPCISELVDEDNPSVRIKGKLETSKCPARKLDQGRHPQM